VSVPATAVYNGGIACTPDGAVYVQMVDGGTQANPTFTGTVTGGVFDLASWGVPFIYVSSGSIGNNGALSGITALPTTYSGGAWVYYPAAAIEAGSAAGWYWTVFSSTTAGTIYNSTYTSGVPAAGTATAFATTGPGAFVSTTAEVAGPTIPIPANQLGANGSIIHNYHAPANTGAGAKTYGVHYSGIGGSLVSQQAPTTGAAAVIGYVANRGATNKQVSSNIQAIVTDTIVTAYLAVDTTAATTLVYGIAKAAAAENAVIERGYVHTIKRP
jgi:hypothetical protein